MPCLTPVWACSFRSKLFLSRARELEVIVMGPFVFTRICFSFSLIFLYFPFFLYFSSSVVKCKIYLRLQFFASPIFVAILLVEFLVPSKWRLPSTIPYTGCNRWVPQLCFVSLKVPSTHRSSTRPNTRDHVSSVGSIKTIWCINIRTV